MDGKRRDKEKKDGRGIKRMRNEIGKGKRKKKIKETKREKGGKR